VIFTKIDIYLKGEHIASQISKILFIIEY